MPSPPRGPAFPLSAQLAVFSEDMEINWTEGPQLGNGRHFLAMGLPGPPHFQLWGDGVRGTECAGGGVAGAAAGKLDPKGDVPGWGNQVSPSTSCSDSVSPAVMRRSPSRSSAHLYDRSVWGESSESWRGWGSLDRPHRTGHVIRTLRSGHSEKAESPRMSARAREAEPPS